MTAEEQKQNMVAAVEAVLVLEDTKIPANVDVDVFSLRRERVSPTWERVTFSFMQQVDP